MAQVRLQRLLAQAGVGARRKSEDLITAGAVTVNGKVVTKLGTKVDPDSDRVAVNGKSVVAQELFYCLFNKPGGCVTTVSDPQGRRTVMEYLYRVPVHVVPVGRLDFYSEGVLLLTNDGELSAALLSPQGHVPKTYHVKLKGNISDAHLRQMRKGVRIDGRSKTREAQVDRLKAKSKHDWLVITITEGKSRQIRRMAEALGHEVIKLQRVSFAGLSFHGLRVGDARELKQNELNALLATAGLARNERRTARGKWTVTREDTELSRRARDRDRPAREVVASPAGARVKSPGRTTKPSGRTTTPSGRTTKPPGRTTTPSGRTTKPSGRTTKPSGRTTKPPGRTTKPSGRTTKPSGRTTKPSTRTAQKAPPGSKPTRRASAGKPPSTPAARGGAKRKAEPRSGSKPSSAAGTRKSSRASSRDASPRSRSKSASGTGARKTSRTSSPQTPRKRR